MKQFIQLLGIIVIVITANCYPCFQPPTSIITCQVKQYNKLESIEFDGSGSHDNDNRNLGYQPKWEWDFNYNASSGFHIAATSTTPYVYRTYPQAGTYYVALRYWDNDHQSGNIDTVKVTITDTRTKFEVIYSYNRADQVDTMSYPSVAGIPLLTHTYDERGRLSNLSDDNTGKYFEDLGYEDNGNIDYQDISCTYTGSGFEYAHSYGYDGMDRLTSVNKSSIAKTRIQLIESFQYDNDGNITSKMNWRGTFQYNYNSGTNELASISGNGTTYNFGYDYRGNMTNDLQRKNTNLDYNYRNLPKTITKTISPGVTETCNYRYDDNGNRVYKEINIPGGTSEQEYYLRDQTGKEIAVYDVATQKLKMVNLYGNDMIGRVNVSSSETQGTDPVTGQTTTYATTNYDRYYYIKDHLGSIVATLDKDCNAVSSQAYSAYGEYLPGTTQTTGGIENEKYKFTGKERDKETNYDYFGARLYDSELGRWLQVDPMTEKRFGITPYNYCQNNPLTRIDPNGLTDIEIHVQRMIESKKSTIGLLGINIDRSNLNKFMGYTLELPDRQNQKNVSRIKAGVYNASLSVSEKLGEVIRLEDKNSRGDILMHQGNGPENTEGCILVGNTKSDDHIGGSKDTKNKLINYIKNIQEQDKENGEPTTIKVIVEDPNHPCLKLDESKNKNDKENQ